MVAGTRAAVAKAEAEKEIEEDALYLAAPLSHAALLLLAVAPMVMGVEANFNILATATLAVFAGAHRSVRPVAAGHTEAMTKQDAMRFPIIGSCVLFSFFLLFKFLPKDLVNKILTGYFVLLGLVALTATMAPVLGRCMPKSVALRQMYLGVLPKIPFITDAPQRVEPTVAEMLSGAVSVGFCAWYILEKHWLANNALGMVFALQGIEFLSLDSIQVGAILLTGLFFYDIFWVFCTPVMVTVAKSFDAPIKLLFPRALDAASVPFSMLGLGDIVIPGIYVALALRMDRARAAAAAAAAQPAPASYFPAVVGGYFTGLATTIVIMNVFHAAQPALLYIVPGVLGATFLRALAAGEVRSIWGYSENDDGSGEGGEAEVQGEDSKKVK
jgi:minor histocompatibility antigen H13